MLENQSEELNMLNTKTHLHNRSIYNLKAENRSLRRDLNERIATLKKEQDDFKLE